MTYDVSLIKDGKEVLPTMMTIHGMGYGSKYFSFARPFIHSDKVLKAEDVKDEFLEFHNLFTKFCQKLMHEGSEDGSYLGSDPTGCYYSYNKIKAYCDEEKIDMEEYSQRFKTTLRWLTLYSAAVALDCEIQFH